MLHAAKGRTQNIVVTWYDPQALISTLQGDLVWI